MLSHPHICHLSNYYPLSVTSICQKEAARRHRLFEPSEIRFEFRFRFGLHIYGNIKLIKRCSCDAHSFKSRAVWNASVCGCRGKQNWMLAYFYTSFCSTLQRTLRRSDSLAHDLSSHYSSSFMNWSLKKWFRSHAIISEECFLKRI